jgi:hypothetical protein
MTSHDLYYPNVGQRLTITDEQLAEIRAAASTVVPSAYYRHMVIWETPLWKEIQMLAITARPKQWVIDKYADNIDLHLKLLSTMYIDEDEDEDRCMMGRKRPFGNSDVLGDVLEAMYEAGTIPTPIDEDGNQIDIIDEDAADSMLEEFTNFVRDFFSDGFVPTTNVFIGVGHVDITNSGKSMMEWESIGVKPEHAYLMSWMPDKAAFRDLKLKELGI